MFYGMALLSPQADGELLVLGSRFFGAPEGEPQAIAYDTSHDRLFVCLRRQLSVWIRVGSPQEFAACLESEFPLAGSEQGLRAAALTPEGDGLFLLSSSGDVLYFETHGFERQAVLTGSLPLSDISSSPLPGGPVLVVEDHTTILACSLVGGEK